MLDEKLYSDYPFYGAFDSDHLNYDPNKPRIKDIVWNHIDWIRDMHKNGKLRDAVLDNCERLLLCNTIYLGYDTFECPKCGNWTLLYHKCHSKFCNTCGVKEQKILSEKASAMCVDKKHRHIVFTIPEEYRAWFRKDRSALNLLFVAARNTLLKVTNESFFRKLQRKKYGKALRYKNTYYLFHNFDHLQEFGGIAAIHTFGRDLKWNPHIHFLVAEIIYDPVSNTYKNFSYFNFESLRKTWQYEVARLMSEHFGTQFKPLKNLAYRKNTDGFYVYAKDRDPDDKGQKERDHSKDVQGCVSYMMRYASRPAMAESRIISYRKETDEVVWLYDDHTTGKRITVHETGLDLLKKMVIHIQDENFRTVRYYGFYNPRSKDHLEKIYALISQKRNDARTKEQRKKQLTSRLHKLRFRTMCLDSYNRDVLRCRCGEIMLYAETYNPLEGISNDRQYRENCIDEMREMRLRRRSTAERSRSPAFS